MEKPAWLEELEQRVARLTAETNATMMAACQALEETCRLVADSHMTLAALREVETAAGDLASRTRRLDSPPRSGLN
jgi:hypothetical protein